jgi:hypothetical protein
MQLYEGRLSLKRTTNKMVVYGNDELKAQYIPKAMLPKERGREYPEKLNFVISMAPVMRDRDGKSSNTKSTEPSLR